MRTAVLVNNYNNAPFLRTCLDSVLSQRPQPDEVVVADDGSTDDSLSVMQEYGDRVRVLARSHGRGTPIQNQADSMEAALRASTADVIFFLDGDDAFLPGKIEAYLREFAADDKVVLVQAPLIKVDADDHVLGYEFESARHQVDYLTHIYREHELNIYYPTSALAFRRSYLETRFPLDVEDGKWIWPDARLALLAPHFGRMVTLVQPYTYWRRHSRSHTVAKALPVYRLVRLNQEYFNQFCRRAGRPLVKPWKSRFHRRRFFRHYFVPEILAHWFRVVRWRTLDEATKRQMLSGPSPADLQRELDRMNRQMRAVQEHHLPRGAKA
jgi:glycosyltransferase involved in cell wall biosynthesis